MIFLGLLENVYCRLNWKKIESQIQSFSVANLPVIRIRDGEMITVNYDRDKPVVINFDWLKLTTPVARFGVHIVPNGAWTIGTNAQRIELAKSRNWREALKDIAKLKVSMPMKKLTFYLGAFKLFTLNNVRHSVDLSGFGKKLENFLTAGFAHQPAIPHFFALKSALNDNGHGDNELPPPPPPPPSGGSSTGSQTGTEGETIPGGNMELENFNFTASFYENEIEVAVDKLVIVDEGNVQTMNGYVVLNSSTLVPMVERHLQTNSIAFWDKLPNHVTSNYVFPTLRIDTLKVDKAEGEMIEVEFEGTLLMKRRRRQNVFKKMVSNFLSRSNNALEESDDLYEVGKFQSSTTKITFESFKSKKIAQEQFKASFETGQIEFSNPSWSVAIDDTSFESNLNFENPLLTNLDSLPFRKNFETIEIISFNFEKVQNNLFIANYEIESLQE